MRFSPRLEREGFSRARDMTAAEIKAKARGLGFDACGIAPAANHPELTFYREWLDRGYAGEMAYLHRSADRRADVRNVVPSARTVISTATVYNTDRPYSTECADPQRAQIARYAWGDDYHDVIGARLDALLAWMRASSPEPFEARAYVDAGPRLRAARRRGVDRQEHLRHQPGARIVDLPRRNHLQPAARCRRAVAGPVRHLHALPRRLSDRCAGCAGRARFHALHFVSLTIELRGDIPPEHRAAVGSHVYGCDICQEVCPWNGAAPRSTDPSWQPRSAWDRVDLLTLARRSDDELTEGVHGSAMRRTKVQGLRRNIAVALANVTQS
jgi:epoxyqueuosine reductase